MARRTANNAIDFERLFAVKDQVAGQKSEEIAQRVEVTTAPVSEPRPVEVHAPVLARPAPPISAPESIRALPRQNETTAPSENPRREDETSAETTLRMGMPRELHKRIRAVSALRGESPAAFVSNVLERVVPDFDANQPLGELARQARSVMPPSSGAARRIEVRMQIPVAQALHRRLQQLSALRGETMMTSFLELVELHVPSM